MAHSLGMPEKMVLQNGTVTSGLEALLITLRRLAYPNRLADMVQMFGRSEPELSMIFNEVYRIVLFNRKQRSVKNNRELSCISKSIECNTLKFNMIIEQTCVHNDIQS